MLTEFQRRIAQAILGSGMDPDLALAGGGALISLRLVPRSTVDLDFFTTGPQVVDLFERIAALLQQEGISIEREMVTETFGRLTAISEAERCRVDIAQDARMWGAIPGPLGPTISPDELAADKTLALFTRAEARDYVDVYYLAERFGKERLLELAREKDRGFDEGVFAQMLGAIGRLDRQEFEVDDATLEDLRAFFESWKTELAS